MFPAYLHNIVTTCSKLTGSLTPKFPLSYPATILFCAAQLTALLYHIFSATSAKSALCETVVLLDILYNIVANIALLVFKFGENFVLLVPLIIPLSRTYFTASAYQTSSATSVKPVLFTVANAANGVTRSISIANNNENNFLHFFICHTSFLLFILW